jgi:hypothetical protein
VKYIKIVSAVNNAGLASDRMLCKADVIFIVSVPFRTESKIGDNKDRFSNELNKYIINDILTTTDLL